MTLEEAIAYCEKLRELHPEMIWWPEYMPGSWDEGGEWGVGGERRAD